MSRARRLLEIAKANEAISSGGNHWWLAEAPPKPDPVPAPPAADLVPALKAEAAIPASVHSAIEAKEPAPEPILTQALDPGLEVNRHSVPEVVHQMAAVGVEPQPVEKRATVNTPDFATRLSGLKEKFSLFGRKTRSLAT